MPDVLIHAFANSKILRQHKLLIVGDGPERANLERFVLERDLHGCVEFKGQRSWAEVAQLMRQADIFAFPSIHELGGGVVVEAMACGLACVVVDYGGPATLVAHDCGIKVPMGTVNYLTEQFQHELEQLVRNPERIQRLGYSANKHAMTYYTWDAKARKTLEIYRWVIRQQKQKPDFWDQSVTSEMPPGSFDSA